MFVGEVYIFKGSKEILAQAAIKIKTDRGRRPQLGEVTRSVVIEK